MGRVCAILLLLAPFSLFAATNPSAPITVEVDASDAPRNIFHSKLTIPATPGQFTLVYPKWIPGNHRPSGPIANATGIRFEAAGKTLSWRRDPLDMYAFHVDVPAGVNEITAWFDALTSGDSAGATGAAASSNLLDLNWNQVVLYPEGSRSDSVQVLPKIKLPQGWKFGTALPVAHQTGDSVEFQTVSLTTLVDSPLIAGLHYRQVPLSKAGETPMHVIDMVADSEAELDMSSQDLTAYQNLVAETGSLFGARHYREYHFLYTLSDEVGHHGLEHHQSSDNSVGGRTLLEPSLHLLEAGLLPHEFVHSWNGKYRRPAGLATKNYQDPMIGDLLWVYEGLTDYLGNVLTARTGLWTDEQYREFLAAIAAEMEYMKGRNWRPLEDTAVSVQSLRLMGPEWQSWRRSLDYYIEGDLIWLEVDTRIRQLTQGAKSLDDFCRRFHGGPSGPPAVVPYTLDDIAKTLNEVTPFDWATLLKQRVRETNNHAPMEGITRGGWRLVFTDKPNLLIATGEKESKSAGFVFSLGFWLRGGGEIGDVVPGSPAYQADLGPGMKVVAVNGRRYSAGVLHQAIKAAKDNATPIELLIENKGFFRNCSISYHDGDRNPHLERVDTEPDRLGEILKPHAQNQQ